MLTADKNTKYRKNPKGMLYQQSENNKQICMRGKIWDNQTKWKKRIMTNLNCKEFQLLCIIPSQKTWLFSFSSSSSCLNLEWSIVEFAESTPRCCHPHYKPMWKSGGDYSGKYFASFMHLLVLDTDTKDVY